MPKMKNGVKNKTYSQQWHGYNQAQINEKAQFQALLYQLCQGVVGPPQAMGRPRALTADLIFCIVLKIYLTTSGRRSMSDLREARRRGYVSKEMHYNTISKYLGDESLTPFIQELITLSSLALKSVECDFAVDSTCFSSGRFARWFDSKLPGTQGWRDWIKVHLICGVKTNIVTGVEITSRNANDSPFMKPLLERTTQSGFHVSEVSADKAYISVNNLQLILLAGATPYIPFKEKHIESEKSQTWNKMLHFYRFRQDEFYAHYHKRSNVESTFSMIKAKFGERIRSRTYIAQVNEVLCKILCHNICVVIHSMYELGVESNFMQIEADA